MMKSQNKTMSYLKNKEFRLLLHSQEPIKQGCTLSLFISDSIAYLSVIYDARLDVFIEFDIDMGNRETPTDEQLELTRNYLKQYE